MRSRRHFASLRANIIRTSIRATRSRRPSSKRSPRPTMLSPTRRSARFLTSLVSIRTPLIPRRRKRRLAAVMAAVSAARRLPHAADVAVRRKYRSTLAGSTSPTLQAVHSHVVANRLAAGLADRSKTSFPACLPVGASRPHAARSPARTLSTRCPSTSGRRSAAV